jgi:type II secretory pathway component PulM
MAKSRWLWGLLGLAVLALAWYFLWSPITPKGQPQLMRLTNDKLFVSQFNRAASNVRMVLLLSPT